MKNSSSGRSLEFLKNSKDSGSPDVALTTPYQSLSANAPLLKPDEQQFGVTKLRWWILFLFSTVKHR
jgi:hypothetical protein